MARQQRYARLAIKETCISWDVLETVSIHTSILDLTKLSLNDIAATFKAQTTRR